LRHTQVQEEEAEGAHERQRSVRRAALAERAAAEAPALRRRVDAAKALMIATPSQSLGEHMSATSLFG
jgi:hypothetical protein